MLSCNSLILSNKKGESKLTLRVIQAGRGYKGKVFVGQYVIFECI